MEDESLEPSSNGLSTPARQEPTASRHSASRRHHLSPISSRLQAGAPKRTTLHRSCPPYNPGLEQFVQAKQAWSEPLDDAARAAGFLGWHQRGYLPHHDLPGVTQLVTMRLCDAMPVARRGEWEALLMIENDRERRGALESYLDRGLGSCWLRQHAIARLVEESLRFWHGARYRLEAWTVMPNHVHVLVEIWQTPLFKLVMSWKRQTARKANQVLRREGSFWQREYWDTIMRDQKQLVRARRYVEQNPVKAGLVREASEWLWTSARFRDEYGVLHFPLRNIGGQPA